VIDMPVDTPTEAPAFTTPQGEPPHPNDDYLSGIEPYGTVTIDIMGNDYNVITISAISKSPAHGSAYMYSSSQITYTNTSLTQSDEIEYSACNPDGVCSSATVHIAFMNMREVCYNKTDDDGDAKADCDDPDCTFSEGCKTTETVENHNILGSLHPEFILEIAPNLNYNRGGVGSVQISAEGDTLAVTIPSLIKISGSTIQVAFASITDQGYIRSLKPNSTYTLKLTGNLFTTTNDKGVTSFVDPSKLPLTTFKTPPTSTPRVLVHSITGSGGGGGGGDTGTPTPAPRTTTTSDGGWGFHVCGDGKVSGSEECDEGRDVNGKPGATCDADCTRPAEVGFCKNEACAKEARIPKSGEVTCTDNTPCLQRCIDNTDCPVNLCCNKSIERCVADSTQCDTGEPPNEPTPEETTEPTSTPSDEPTSTPTEEAVTPSIDTATPQPTDAATETPTETPTEGPTLGVDTETPQPTDAATETPTETPTEGPTLGADTETPQPTDAPTETATDTPTPEITPAGVCTEVDGGFVPGLFSTVEWNGVEVARDHCGSYYDLVEFSCDEKGSNPPYSGNSVNCVQLDHGKTPCCKGGQCVQCDHCNDPDGLDPTLKTFAISGQTRLDDTCFNSETVQEAYCPSNQEEVAYTNISCPRGTCCINGACVSSETNSCPKPPDPEYDKCVDSDGGDEPYVQGAAAQHGLTHSDYCSSGKILKEAICTNNEWSYIDEDCTDGGGVSVTACCRGGRCVDDCKGSCIDRDGLDIFKESDAYFAGESGSQLRDTCEGLGAVSEAYCPDPYLHPQRVTLSCPPNMYCDQGRCAEKSRTCTDSDGGDVPKIKGQVDITYLDGGAPYTTNYSDECVNGNRSVLERTCGADSQLVSVQHYCDESGRCEDGQCMPPRYTCTDLDGGKDLHIASSAQVADQNGTVFDTVADRCSDAQDNIVYEAVCPTSATTWGSRSNPFSPSTSVETCPQGEKCINGACSTDPIPPRDPTPTASPTPVDVCCACAWQTNGHYGQCDNVRFLQGCEEFLASEQCATARVKQLIPVTANEKIEKVGKYGQDFKWCITPPEKPTLPSCREVHYEYKGHGSPDTGPQCLDMVMEACVHSPNLEKVSCILDSCSTVKDYDGVVAKLHEVEAQYPFVNWELTGAPQISWGSLACTIQGTEQPTARFSISGTGVTAEFTDCNKLLGGKNQTRPGTNKGETSYCGDWSTCPPQKVDIECCPDDPTLAPLKIKPNETFSCTWAKKGTCPVY